MQSLQNSGGKTSFNSINLSWYGATIPVAINRKTIPNFQHP